MADLIQLRRDIKVNWDAVSGSVILADGEVGIICDQSPLQCKVGDGVSYWNQLETQAFVEPGNIDQLSGSIAELSGSVGNFNSVNVGSQPSLLSATTAVPSGLRKPGLILSYYNTEELKWVLKRYVGITISGWNDENYWEDVSSGGGSGESGNYNELINKPSINGTILAGNKTSDQLGIPTIEQVNVLEDKINNLPTGMYYGQYPDVSSLPDAGTLENKGYAYVASADPAVYYIYLFEGTGSNWENSGNKFVTTKLETNLATKSQTKAPTTKAVYEGIEAVNLIDTKSTPLTVTQKYNASANINDRGADVAPVTGVVKALGYKILNPNQSFVSQVVDANTVYEIRDYFDLSGTEQSPATVTVPANCKLRFEGGMLGGEFCTLQGNNTLIESNSTCIQKGITIAGTWGNDTIYTKWLEFVSVKDAYLPAAAGTEGVMHPVFEDGVYYKSGINWLLLTSNPDDWETNYADYYELLDNKYIPVTEVAPPYTKNTYYELYDDGTYHLITTDTAPDDWDINYMDYYVNNSGTHVSGVAPEFKTDTYYKNNGIGYERLIEKPNDWVANWDEYFVKDGNNYITPMGVIDNPNATNNILQFKQLQNFINGSKNCKVEFEKGTYQSNIINVTPNGNTYNNRQPTTVKDGVTYEVWSTNIHKPDKWIILNILNTSVEINLNGSTLIGLRNTCPSWDFINYAGDGYCYIHDGEVIGFADHFDYPSYVNWDNKITANYEFAVQVRLGGGTQKVENITSKYTTSDGIYVGSGGFYYRGGELPYPTELSGFVKYPCTSYEIKNCEVCYCARNGFGLLSSHAGTLKNNHIHHIGSTGASGTIGSDGIKGQSPQAGIDVEFEDGQGLRPIMQWDGLKIHDCRKKAFGFATVKLSLMESFIATNLVIEGMILTNNIKTVDGLPIFKGCSFTIAYGNGTMLGKAVYENCSFDIQTPLTMGNNEYYNCTFVDNCSTERIILFTQYAAKALYQNCHLLLKHSCHLSYGSFISCVFEFDSINQQKYTIYVGDCTFSSCSFKVLFTTQDNRNIRFTRQNIGDFCNFTNCSFDNILGTDATESGRCFFSADFTFEDCKGNINVCAGNHNLAIVNCEGQYISVSGYDSGEGKNINITGCNYKSWGIVNIPRENIVVKDSVVVFPYNGQCRSHCKFINCDITYGQTAAGYFDLVSDNKIFDSVVSFSNSIANSKSENRISLTNSYIKGAATQAAFKGATTDCVFKNNADSGTSAQRPLYNLVVGQRYFDTTLGKPIYWNGTAWVDKPNVRPGENIPIGFEIYDLELKKPIYWDGYAWRDVNGSYIFDNSGTLQNRLALTTPIKGQQFKLTREGETDVYLIYGDYGWLNATDRSPWFDDSGYLNAMYDKYNYTLLTEEPSNWPTAYKTYYKIVDGVYTKLTASETWALNTYYKKDENVYTGIQVKLTDADTKLHDKIVKWDGTKYRNIIDNVALKAGTPEVTFTTENNTTTAAITSTSSGKIYYTKNGKNPTSSSTKYSSAITLADGDQVKAICIRDHMNNSNIGFVPVAKPVITFNDDGILHIECDTPDAKIYYTTDGNPPSTSSTVYDSSASVTIATGITVNAFATLIGRVNSEIASEKRS